MGHKSQGTCIPLWQAQGKGSKLALLEILQISRLTKFCKSLALQSLANLSRPKILLISRVAPKNSCLKCQILIYFSCVTLGIFGFRNRSPLPHYVDVFRFQQVIFYILSCLRKTGLLIKQICSKTLLCIVKRQP